MTVNFPELSMSSQETLPSCIEEGTVSPYTSGLSWPLHKDSPNELRTSENRLYPPEWAWWHDVIFQVWWPGPCNFLPATFHQWSILSLTSLPRAWHLLPTLGILSYSSSQNCPF
jgi:hypothetical protein